MIITRFVTCSSILALSLAAGMAGEKDEAMQSVQQSVQERTGKAVRWEQDEASRAANLQDAKMLLRKPLTVNSAVQIALLNNRSLQATFEDIGLSAADLREASTLPNPTFSGSLRVPNRPPSAVDYELGAAIDFLNLLALPLKRRVAQDQLRAASLRVADETISLVADVKGAFYTLQGAQQLLGRLKLIVETNAAALQLAQAQHGAGNITDLALAQQQATYSQSRLDVATTESEIRQDREKLNELLGLWGPDTDWIVAGNLPSVPATDPSSGRLEKLAVSQRLDLAAAYSDVVTLVNALGLAKSFRFFGVLNFGFDYEEQTDSQAIRGPDVTVTLPIFNQGQPRIARSEAELRRAERRLEAKAIEIRSTSAPRQDGEQMADRSLLPERAVTRTDSDSQWNASGVQRDDLRTVRAIYC
jgi:cobalt-zinc-cadmium efflux system outer membrane protein